MTEPSRLVDERLRDHDRRCERIVAILEEGPRTAYEIAGRLWSARTVAEQPLLVVWEVVGHLELLLAGGHVVERGGAGRSVFALTDAWRALPRLAVAARRAHRRPAPARSRHG